MAGQVLLLMGEDLTHYRVWDGMRAIDYLLTRRKWTRSASPAPATPAAARSRFSSRDRRSAWDAP